MRRCSLGCDAEWNGVRDFDLAAHEAARYSSTPARFEDRVEPVLGSAGDGDVHGVRGEAADCPADVVETADDGHALDATAPECGVVVDEADDALARRLAQLAQQAAAAAPGADDEDPPLISASDERRQPARERSFPETGEPDQEGAQQHVDQVDAARE